MNEMVQLINIFLLMLCLFLNSKIYQMIFCEQIENIIDTQWTRSDSKILDCKTLKID